MKACGLIVEYNPFHNGHLYHVQQAKTISSADCIIAVMSGSFLQRGEPAVMDKFHRTRAALAAGVDIVLELPYVYAVQSSKLFAKGAVHTLKEIGAESLCFGSESGNMNDFISSYHILKENESKYKDILKKALNEGVSFPEASSEAYHQIGLTANSADLSKPNNILGFSYVKTILDAQLPIQPMTIKRIKNDYHDKNISSPIASATSIREQLLTSSQLMTAETLNSMPESTARQLNKYKQTTDVWHHWEKYFPFIYYRILTMDATELATFYGVDEGIEHRIIKMAKNCTSFHEWVNAIKTKRYTWTRIQRMFVHILTNTKKAELGKIDKLSSVPYIRMLGVSEAGRTYLNDKKKEIDIPLITSLSRHIHPFLTIEERATNAYYSIFSPELRKQLHIQELGPPIMTS